MNSSMEPERRHFSRVRIDGSVQLSCPDGRWNGHLVDISLKGALISCPGECRESDGETECLLIIRLPGDVVIEMRGVVAHSSDGLVGFRCDSIELDAISHLRRLVELNLGNADQLERELSELVSEAQQ